MTASTLTAEGLAGRFAPSHPWDRWFFPMVVGLIWLGVVMGFAPGIARHFARHEPPFPPILHLHGMVFGGWLWLLTAQVLLIRTGRTALHRRLGIAGAVLAPVVFAVGLATAYVMDRLEFGTAKDDTAFLFVQATDMLAFGALAGAGLLLRSNGAAHRRLMLMSTIYIADAGFSRWLGPPIVAALGETYWPILAALYLGSDALQLAIGGYDLATRRRLHPAWLAAFACIVPLQLVSVYYYHSDPGWRAMAIRIIGH